MVLRPRFNLFTGAIGPAGRPPVRVIVRLEKALIIALQLVIEHDATHARARFVEARRRCRVRAIQPRIVPQLTRLGDTGVIRLPSFAVLRTLMPYQKSLALAAERHDGRALAIEDLRRELHEPG